MQSPSRMPDSFLILHGFAYDGDPDHWHNRLARELCEAGAHVAYPRLPSPEAPRLGEWLAVLRDELEAIAAARCRVVICHSLGSLLWLRNAPALERPVERLLLVAPPEDAEIPPPAAEFAVGTPDVDAIRASSVAPPRLVRGERDPYSPAGVPPWAVAARCELDELAGAEHLNPDDGHGPWPSPLSWCLDPSVRFVP